jgi:hypothetical protein
LDIHINKPILFEVKFIGDKGEFDKGLLTMKKRKLLFKQRCARSSYYLAIKLSPVRGLKVPIPPVTKVPSPLKAPTRMYAILFIFIPRE